MRSRLEYQLSLVALFATAILGLANPIGSTRANSEPGDPSIKLQGLDGQTYDVADLRGNVVLVSFGATWCVPCSGELHALEEMKREYAAKPVKFFWVSIESDEQVSNGRLKRYVRERKVTFPVLRDPLKVAFTQFSQRVRLPMIVFLAKDGHLDTPVQFGMNSRPELYKAELRARLNKLLG